MTRSYLTAYLGTAVVMVALDMLWLGVVAKALYQGGIGHLMAEQPRIGRDRERAHKRRPSQQKGVQQDIEGTGERTGTEDRHRHERTTEPQRGQGHVARQVTAGHRDASTQVRILSREPRHQPTP
mgnify:CR=1 FL=1